MSTYSARQLHDLWLQANPSSDGITAWEAAAIALAESGGDPSATGHNKNGTTDIGLWQINSSHGALASYDPIVNAQSAFALMNESLRAGSPRWAQWCTAYGDGACGTQGGKYGAVTAPAWKIYLSSWFKSASKGSRGGQAPGKGDIPIVGGVLNALPSSSPLSWTEGIAALAKNLLDPRFWLRIGQGLAAAILLLIGGGLVFRRDATAALKMGALA